MNDHIDVPNGDDPHDQRLADLLGRVGGSTLSTEEAFARVTAKVRRVRQVRLAVSAAAVACIVGAGSLVLVRESSPGRDNSGIPLSEGSTPIESTPDSENDSTDQTNVVVGGDGENSGEPGSTDGSSSGTGITMPGAVSGGSGSSGSNGTGSSNNSGGTAGNNSGGTSGNNTGNNTGNGGSSGGAAGSTVPGGNIGAVGEDDPTPTTKAPVPTTKAPVLTVPPATVPPTVPPTTKAPTVTPTTKAPVPTVPPTTKAPSAPPTTKAPSAPPTTKAPVPTVPPTTVPPTMAPTVPPTTTAPTAPPTLPTPPSAPVNPVTVRACGSGVLSVEVANGSFVLASLNLTVAPGFTSKIEDAKAKSISVVFESANGKITANLKVQITGSTVKHKCDVEVDSDSDESNDDDTDDASTESTTTLPQAEKTTGNKK